MKTYLGKRQADGSLEVGVRDGSGNERPLDPRFDLRNHSPTGFEVAYGGSGPAQLALALLADALGDDEEALGLYQRYKFRVIARLPRDADWALTQEEVLRAMALLR